MWPADKAGASRGAIKSFRNVPTAGSGGSLVVQRDHMEPGTQTENEALLESSWHLGAGDLESACPTESGRSDRPVPCTRNEAEQKWTVAGGAASLWIELPHNSPILPGCLVTLHGISSVASRAHSSGAIRGVGGARRLYQPMADRLRRDKLVFRDVRSQSLRVSGLRL